MQQSVGVPSLTSSGWTEEDIRRVNVNFMFENFEGHDEVSSAASTFQGEDATLAALQGAGRSPLGLHQPSVLGRCMLKVRRTRAQNTGIDAVLESL